jgi:hypothetical protein
MLKNQMGYGPESEKTTNFLVTSIPGLTHIDDKINRSFGDYLKAPRAGDEAQW